MDQIFRKIVDEHNYLKTIDRVHDEIHTGGHFTACHSTSGSAGSTTYIILQTASTAKYSHAVASIYSNVLGQFTFNTDATVSSSYTALNANNNYLASTITAVLNVGVMPTSSGASTATYGTIIENGIVGGAVGSQKIGGDAGTRNEWILKNNTKYCVRYTSTDAYNVLINVRWYEEDRVS